MYCICSLLHAPFITQDYAMAVASCMESETVLSFGSWPESLLSTTGGEQISKDRYYNLNHDIETRIVAI